MFLQVLWVFVCEKILLGDSFLVPCSDQGTDGNEVQQSRLIGFLGGFNWLAGLSLRLRLSLLWGFLGGSTRPLLRVVVVVIVVAIGVNVLWRGRAA